MSPPTEPDAPPSAIPPSAKTQIEYAVEALRMRLPPGYTALVISPPTAPLVCVRIADDAVQTQWRNAPQRYASPVTAGAFGLPVAPPPADPKALCYTTVPSTDAVARLVTNFAQGTALTEDAMRRFTDFLDVRRDAEAGAFAGGYIAATLAHSPEAARLYADMFDLIAQRIAAKLAGDGDAEIAALDRLNEFAARAFRMAGDAADRAVADAASSADPVPAFLARRLRAEIDAALATLPVRSADSPYDPS